MEQILPLRPMKDRIDLQGWLLLISLTLIWGTSYILMKRILVVYTPMEMASLRIGIAGLVCIPFLGQALKHIPRAKFGKAFFVGAIGSGIPAFLFAYAMSRISSSVGGIINSLSPLFTVLTGLIFWRIHAPGIKVLGIFIGFVGAVVLIFGKHGLEINGDVGYAALPVIATFCYGLNSNYVRQNFPATNSVMLTVLGMTMAGLPALAILFGTDFIHRLHGPGGLQALAYAGILGAFNTVLSNILFYKLIQHSGALFAASVTYLIPIVAIGWGVRDHEGIAAYHFAGLALILVGVYFVSRQGKAKAES
jgi:drug/metabolite transporter (DMT)-like permease